MTIQKYFERHSVRNTLIKLICLQIHFSTKFLKLIIEWKFIQIMFSKIISQRFKLLCKSQNSKMKAEAGNLWKPSQTGTITANINAIWNFKRQPYWGVLKINYFNKVHKTLRKTPVMKSFWSILKVWMPVLPNWFLVNQIHCVTLLLYWRWNKELEMKWKRWNKESTNHIVLGK